MRSGRRWRGRPSRGARHQRPDLEARFGDARVVGATLLDVRVSDWPPRQGRPGLIDGVDHQVQEALRRVAMRSADLDRRARPLP